MRLEQHFFSPFERRPVKDVFYFFCPKLLVIIADIVEIALSDTLTWFLKRKSEPYRLVTIAIRQVAV